MWAQEAHICARREHNELAPLRRDVKNIEQLHDEQCDTSLFIDVNPSLLLL